MSVEFHNTKFQPGQIVVTPLAMKVEATRVASCLRRHLSGDWGDICEEDAQQNDDCLRLELGNILMSAYAIDVSKPVPKDSSENVFWIITAGDRSHTTVLLPEEY